MVCVGQRRFGFGDVCIADVIVELIKVVINQHLSLVKVTHNAGAPGERCSSLSTQSSLLLKLHFCLGEHK